MPRGTYVHLFEDGQVEESFQCAPGPGGWRYVGERSDGLRTDLTVDARWRQIRVELSSPGWRIRGGVTGHDLIWVRSPQERESSERAFGFLGESPGFLVAIARSLGLDPGGDAVVRLVRVEGMALSALTVDQRWRLAEIETYETETAPLPVERYEITDLATAESHAIHLGGDVVMEAPGVELTNLESPPTL